jgi:hypothetical protein
VNNHARSTAFNNPWAIAHGLLTYGVDGGQSSTVAHKRPNAKFGTIWAIMAQPWMIAHISPQSPNLGQIWRCRIISNNPVTPTDAQTWPTDIIRLFAPRSRSRSRYRSFGSGVGYWLLAHGLRLDGCSRATLAGSWSTVGGLAPEHPSLHNPVEHRKGV